MDPFDLRHHPAALGRLSAAVRARREHEHRRSVLTTWILVGIAIAALGGLTWWTATPIAFGAGWSTRRFASSRRDLRRFIA